MKISIISFSDRGDVLAHRIEEGLLDEEIFVAQGFGANKVPVKMWVKKQFEEADAMIFVGAMGICVRMIAPYIQSKVTDPCVIVLDELGSFCVSVLSGHIGGGNTFTNRVADLVGATPVITTATDINDVFAIDSFAVKQGFAIHNTHCIKHISSKLLKGETVRIYSDFPVKNVPADIIVDVKGSLDIGSYDAYITYRSIEKEDVLILVPKVLQLGIGCKKDKEYDVVENFFDHIIKEYGLHKSAFKGLGSIDIKSEEKSILQLGDTLKLPMKFFGNEVLNAQVGTVSKSDFVLKTVGTDCVCERSAVALGGTLLVPKQSHDGVTLAVALEEIVIDFKYED